MVFSSDLQDVVSGTSCDIQWFYEGDWFGISEILAVSGTEVFVSGTKIGEDSGPSRVNYYADPPILVGTDGTFVASFDGLPLS
jgi:hypothetical protein